LSDNTILTQEQIEEMLRSAGQVDAPAAPAAVDLNTDTYLTRDEQDALGEMGNICMGTSATTMYTLLGKQVMITTPMLTCHTWETLAAEHPLPLVVVEVQYIEGISGNNLLLLKEYDVALITDLLMGGDGNIDPDNIVLDEISLSAIREVMNQMVGASATSLASMLMKTVNISTPTSKRILVSKEALSDSMDDGEVLLKIAFRMEIEGLLTSEIMQILPMPFAQELAHDLLNPAPPTPEPIAAVPAAEENIYPQIQANVMPETPAPAPEPAPAPPPPPQATPYQPPQMDPAAMGAAPQPYPPQPPMGDPAMAGYPPYQQPYQQPYPPQGYPQTAPGYPPAAPGYPPYPQQAYPGYPPAAPGYPPYPPYPGYPPQAPGYGAPGMIRPQGSVDVKDVDYPVFNAGGPAMENPIDTQNLWRLLDVPMEVTVELGRCSKTIKQVLDLNVGSVVVLEKLAGEPVEIMVNGIQVARGEVVVIDESYGVRITELNTAEINEIAKSK